MAKRSFEDWKRNVDGLIQRMCGMSADDIDDWRYTDDWREGRTPMQSAKRAIKNAKEACGL